MFYLFYEIKPILSRLFEKCWWFQTLTHMRKHTHTLTHIQMDIFSNKESINQVKKVYTSNQMVPKIQWIFQK